MNHPHRRFNSLTGEWVLVSPHRTQRPWQGRQEKTAEDRPAHDPTCYLCPGNTRAGGEKNPAYTQPFVFDNDYAALLPEAQPAAHASDPLFRSEPVRGTCRVVCFSPRHDLTLPQMAVSDIAAVVDLWSAQAAELSQTYRWVQIFENKGDVMGCSNPHPHGQIWASDSLPNEAAKEDRTQLAYWQEHGTPLLLDYAAREAAAAERVVVENADWIAVVPYWAVWPFETLLLPRRAVQRLPDLSAQEKKSLAEILKRLLTRYDNLFETSFPYSMGWHAAPGAGPEPHWQLHAHFYPPLLRSASVRKFMVGYELLGEAQRDLTPETAAQRLRELSEVYYKDKEKSS